MDEIYALKFHLTYVDMPKEFIGSDITITAEQAKKYNIDFKVTGLMYRPKK